MYRTALLGTLPLALAVVTGDCEGQDTWRKLGMAASQQTPESGETEMCRLQHYHPYPPKNKKSEEIRRNSATSEDCDSPSNIFLQTAHHRQREEKYHWPSGRGRFPFFAVSENNAPFHVNNSLAWHLWLGFRCGWGKPMNGKTRCYPSVRSQPCQISQFGGCVEEYQFSCDWLVFTKLEGKAWWNSSMITVPVAVAVVPTLSPSNFQRALKMGSHGRSGEGSRDR